METPQNLSEQLKTLLADTTVQASLVVAGLLIALACCRIYSKAGFHGGMGLLMLIPGVNIIMLLTLAFGRWPLEREVRELRKLRKAVHKAEDKTLRRAA